MRVGPIFTSFNFDAILSINPIPVTAALDSNLGLDSCSPTCLTINSGPLAKSVRNFPIRIVSTTDAFAAPTIPPLTKPSSKLPITLAPGLLISV